MILLETSVVVDYLRGDAKVVGDLPTLAAGVCGVTRAEIVGGQRGPRHRARQVAVLDQFLQVPIPEGVWDRAGDHFVALRAAGVAVPFPDLVIAAVAIDAGLELWARDRHFALIRAVLPALRLFAEPP